MTTRKHDVIVVGARCAGAPTAMRLAGTGHRVLVLDRATFPSDTISTHLVHPPGVAALERWGLLDRVTSTGCPPIDTYVFDFGDFAISGRPGPPDAPVSYAPRRTVLDEILVDAAREAGAEVREGWSVSDVLHDDGRVAGVRGTDAHGRSFSARAQVVIGADGVHSTVARAVDAETYDEKPRLLAGYYTYWSGLPMNGRFETYVRPGRGMAAWPTNDDLTLLIAGWPYSEFAEHKNDIEASYMKTLELAPALAERVRSARREERFVGTAVPNYFRKPYGPGWALVGDAGYNKDFITAQGMSDAFVDAERCAAALHDAFSGSCSFEDAMAGYHSARDERVRSMYEFTAMLATLQPPPPELARVLAAIPGKQEAMDGFAQMNAGVTPPATFFSEENVARILGSPG